MVTTVKKVAIVSPVVSYPSFSGNSSRIAQFIDVLESLNIEVYFVLTPTKCMHDQRSGDVMEAKFGNKFHVLNKGERSRGSLLNRLWLRVKKQARLEKINFFFDLMFPWQLFHKEMLAEFNQVIEQINPDFILAEYLVTAPLLKSLNKDIPNAVDTHDCFTDRNNKIRLSGGSGFWWSLTKSQETSLLEFFDNIIAIQEHEKYFFQSLLGGKGANKVKKVDILCEPPKVSSLNKKNSIVGFIGSNNHHNREGLQLFIQNQWPKIKASVPTAELWVAGDVQFNSTDKTIIKLGRVNDLFEDFYKQCFLVINPCLSGTGLKIKTVEAMTYGVPVVATAEGLSGIEDAIGNGALLADLSSEMFAEKCTLILRDSEFRMQQEKLAKKYIQESHQKSISNIKDIFNI